ncbi:MAG: DNA polymerase III subunit alpha, partial [Flavobacterium sp.]|nr:DNA polymerase III subunit alpha [Flavobacterium sp.]
SSQVSLFGETSDVQIPEPVIPPCEDWSTMEKLAKEKEVVGIYISGHPLDDYRFEMKYFCNAKLDALKNLEAHVNKNLTVGGIITDVQHRVAKNGKGWASFVLEGYDESAEFRIFGEEYLKFRHFLIQNNFTYMKILVREGWANAETGKKGEPRIQFIGIQYLQDVLTTFAKKLIIQMNIRELHSEMITKLSHIFQANRGENNVTFEVMETEKITKEVPVAVEANADEVEAIPDMENAEEMELNVPAVVEETKVITYLSMPSRKLKVNICGELLRELEKLQVNFKLN